MSFLLEWPYGPGATFLSGLALGLLLAFRGARRERVSWPNDAEAWAVLVTLNCGIVLGLAHLFAGLSLAWGMPVLGFAAGFPLHRLAARAGGPSGRAVTAEGR